jgi:hypothetical protein
VAAEWYQYFDTWIKTYFGGLQVVDNWRLFYFHLVERLAKMLHDGIAAEYHDEEENEHILIDSVYVPRCASIVNVCRLLYQAISGIRNAVPDGQHRIAGMIQLFTGYKVTNVDSRYNPPRSFELDDSFTKAVEDEEEETVFENDLNVLMERSVERVGVRILVPSETRTFETAAEHYSMVRAESQALTRPRVLSDV